MKIENPKSLKENKANNEELKSTTEGKNLIQNIKYSSNNNRGDIYQIISEYGETYSDNPDLMFLTNSLIWPYNWDFFCYYYRFRKDLFNIIQKPSSVQFFMKSTDFYSIIRLIIGQIN